MPQAPPEAQRAVTDAAPQARRAASLDGLRGLAALTVVAAHSTELRWSVWQDPGDIPMWFQAIPSLGSDAVDVFFVLSGTVVWWSWKRAPQYVPYLLGRSARLLPVAWAGAALGLSLHLIPEAWRAGMSSLIRHETTLPVTLSDAAGLGTLLWPEPRFERVNIALWSVMLEYRVAWIMPLLGLSGRWPWPLLTVACAAVWLLAIALELTGTRPGGLDLPTLCAHLPAFMLGAWLAERRPQGPAGSATSAGTGPQMLARVTAGLALLLLPRALLGPELAYTAIAAAPTTIGAALLVSATLRGWAWRALTHRWSQWLGKVSYSLYATHLVALAWGAAALGTLGVPTVTGALLSLPAALLLAAGVWRAVERPSTRLSARLRRRQADPDGAAKRAVP